MLPSLLFKVWNTSGLVVCLSGTDRNYKYLIAGKGRDLSADIKEINKTLLGRGGGRGEMVTGTFSCDLVSIEEYFK